MGKREGGEGTGEEREEGGQSSSRKNAFLPQEYIPSNATSVCVP